MTQKRTIKQNNSKHISLFSLLVVLFIIEVSIIVGSIGYLSYKNGKEAVNDISSTLRKEIAFKIEEHIKHYLSTPEIVNNINANAISRGDLSLSFKGDLQYTEYYLWQMINNFKQVGWIILGSHQDGGAVSIRRIPKSGELHFIIDTQETDYFTVDYSINSKGQRNQLMKRFNEKYDARKRPWYIEAVKAKKTVWTSIYPAFDYGTRYFDLVQPIYDKQSNLLLTLSIYP